LLLDGGVYDWFLDRVDLRLKRSFVERQLRLGVLILRVVKTRRASALDDLRVNEEIVLFYLDDHCFKLLWLELLEVLFDELCRVEADTGFLDGCLNALFVI
jgi:hypothetical protein